MLDSLSLMLDECSVSMRGFLFYGSMTQMGSTPLVRNTQFYWLLSTWRECGMRRYNLLLSFGKVGSPPK